ncbi:MAG: hypothetical protein L6Q97_25675, partial [Thermoanaerobaculia bacterium]|nr:hypothetical protein [Thermoanaerobaculia bacterium]
MITQSVPIPFSLVADTSYGGAGQYRLSAINDSIWPVPDFAIGRRYWLEFQVVHPCYGKDWFLLQGSMALKNYLYSGVSADSLWTDTSYIEVDEIIIASSLDYANAVATTPSWVHPEKIMSEYVVDTNIVEWTIHVLHRYASGIAQGQYLPIELPIPFPWIALEPQSSLEILNFTDITNPAQPSDLPLLPYGTNGSVWVQLPPLLTSIDSGGYYIFRIRARFQDCLPGFVRLLQGFNCKGFPTDPDAGYLFGDEYCSKYVQEMQLWYYPQKAGFLLEYIKQPDSLPSLCTPFDYEILVKNYRSGNAGNLRVTATLPPGVSLVSVEIRYPSDSAFLVLPPPDTTGGFMSWDIPSDVIAKLQGWEKAPLNEFIIRLRLTTDCDFIAGLSPAFGVSGTDICGERHFSPFFYAPPLNVKDNGATKANSYDLHLELNPNENCAPGARMRIRLRNDGGGPNGASLPGEKVRLVLKDDFGYLPGSCIPIQHFDTTNTNPIVRHTGDWNILEWPLLTGVVAGEYIEFDIGITTQCASNCDKLDAVLQSIAPALTPCGPDTCSVDKVMKEVYFEGLDLLPRFQFPGISASSQPLGAGLEELHVQYSLENITDIPAPGPLLVSFYADNNGNGQYDPDKDTLIGTDALDGKLLPFTREAILIVPNGSACRVLAVLSALENDCTCYTAEIPVPPPPLNYALPDT